MCGEYVSLTLSDPGFFFTSCLFRKKGKRTKILTHLDFFNDAVDKKEANGSALFKKKKKNEHFKNNKWLFQTYEFFTGYKMQIILLPLCNKNVRFACRHVVREQFLQLQCVAKE